MGQKMFQYINKHEKTANPVMKINNTLKYLFPYGWKKKNHFHIELCSRQAISCGNSNMMKN
jgi:hypothetical protein